MALLRGFLFDFGVWHWKGNNISGHLTKIGVIGFRLVTERFVTCVQKWQIRSDSSYLCIYSSTNNWLSGSFYFKGLVLQTRLDVLKFAPFSMFLGDRHLSGFVIMKSYCCSRLKRFFDNCRCLVVNLHWQWERPKDILARQVTYFTSIL